MTDWNQIVKQNARIVVDAAFRVLGSAADAEDVAQGVFLEAFSKWDSTVNNHWAGLLRQMAVRRAIDALRSRRETCTLPVPLVDASALEPEQEFVSQELSQAVRNSVAELPPREAEVFCLAYFEQLSHDQIAATLQIQKSAVAAALSRARAKLAAMLNPAEKEI